MELADAAEPPKSTEKVGGNIKINLKSETVAPSPVAVPPLRNDGVPVAGANTPFIGKKGFNPVEILHMSTYETPIHITNKNPKTYRDCTTYDRNLNKTGKFWDMVVIHHNNKYSKTEILEACFKITGNCDFYPVAYRKSRLADLFLLRLCQAGLTKLFLANLKLLMPDGQNIDITIKFEVAEYQTGQIQVRTKLLKLLRQRRENLINLNGISKVLSLDNLAKDPEMNEVVVDFGSNAALAMLTSLLNLNQDLYRGDINGILLSNNGIKHFNPFKILAKTYIRLIDISNNLVDRAKSVSGLDPFVFTEIVVTGNPFVQDPTYVKELCQAFPVVKKINGVSVSLGNQTAPAPFVKTVTQLPNVQSPVQCMRSPEKSGASTTTSDVPTTVPFQIKVKGFAQVGGPPLPKDPSAASGAELTGAGKIISTTDCDSPGFFRQYKQSAMWHRVVIHHNGAYTKHQILVSLHKLLATTDIYPCYYTEYPKCDTFFVYNSYDALEQLVVAKLLVRMESHNVYCTLSLHMNVSNFKAEQVDALESIRNVIGKCFTLMDRTLDLTAFSSHSEFEHIDLSLSNPATMSHVLITAARRYFANIQTVRFCGNALESTLGMRPLSWMTDLATLDLSTNSIPTMAALETLPALPRLTEIDLRGNPLGRVKMNPTEYVSTMTKMFPELNRLDGLSFASAAGCSVGQRNYLCSVDGYELVEQFVMQFFETYDANSQLLKDFYLSTSIMTISCAVTGNDFTDKQLRKYTMRSRNLTKIANRPGADLGVLPTYVGGESISAVWLSLGKTLHDFQSFTVDLTHFSDSMVVLTVNGLFKDIATNNSVDDLVLGFVRTFVLRRSSSGLGMFGCGVQYRINNEQLLIYRPSVRQLKQAFPAKELEAPVVEEEITKEDKDGMVIMFQELSNLVPLWCIRFLEQASWHFKNALELFVHLCEDGQVPDVAFLEFSQK